MISISLLFDSPVAASDSSHNSFRNDFNITGIISLGFFRFPSSRMTSAMIVRSFFPLLPSAPDLPSNLMNLSSEPEVFQPLRDLI